MSQGNVGGPVTMDNEDPVAVLEVDGVSTSKEIDATGSWSSISNESKRRAIRLLVFIIIIELRDTRLLSFNALSVRIASSMRVFIGA